MTNLHTDHEINALVRDYLDNLYYEGYTESLNTDAFEWEKEQFISNHLNAA